MGEAQSLLSVRSSDILGARAVICFLGSKQEECIHSQWIVSSSPSLQQLPPLSLGAFMRLNISIPMVAVCGLWVVWHPNRSRHFLRRRKASLWSVPPVLVAAKVHEDCAAIRSSPGGEKEDDIQ